MLEVIEPGLLTTVQDGGRPTAVALGVPRSGACDPWSLAAANALLGNGQYAAGLEMTMLGPTLRALVDCAVALAGADMKAKLDGRPIPGDGSFDLRAGQILTLGAAVDGGGIRTYLALAGGIDVPVVLGSRSTCLVGGFGGLAGRPLRPGDVIGPLSIAGPPAGPRRWPTPVLESAAGVVELRIVAGPDAGRLGGSGLGALTAVDWTVGGRGDRQGIRLEGTRVAAAGAEGALSHGVTWGAIQLPPDGQPILLLADHQTVGGYPVPAVVITADLPLAGQLGPTDRVALVEVSLEAARAALIERRARFAAAVAQLR